MTDLIPTERLALDDCAHTHLRRDLHQLINRLAGDKTSVEGDGGTGFLDGHKPTPTNFISSQPAPPTTMYVVPTASW